MLSTTGQLCDMTSGGKNGGNVPIWEAISPEGRSQQTTIPIFEISNETDQRHIPRDGSPCGANYSIE